MFKLRNLKFSSVTYTFLQSLFLMTACNLAFFSAINQFTGLHQFTDILFLISTALLFGSVTFITLLLVNLPYLVRIITPIILLSSASAAYFTSNYGVLIHEIMIQNVLETDPREIKGLLNIKLIGYWIILGVIPCVAFHKIKFLYKPFWQEIKLRLKAILGAILLMFASVVPFSAEYYSFFHDHIAIRQQSVPLSFIYATTSYALGDSSLSQTKNIKKIGEDAQIKTSINTHKPTLFILVLGEAARADHFSINGYTRPTNTALTQETLLNFSNVWSCGTETAVSVPCMFSGLGKSDYSERKAKSQESLLDVIAHANYKVLWRDNNSGCKETCNRVTFENLAYLNEPGLCEHNECYDEILLWQLEQRLSETQQNQFIVLHQKGSHGPDYYNRVPEANELFKPICKENLLQNCTPEKLTNAYDNTIAYTDKILTKVIEFLKQHSANYSTGFLYLSDHGESLGESNIYLHGLPYAIAPDAQKHIPFMVWFSEGFVQSREINLECLKNKTNQRYSQDNLYHSVLGLLEIETKVYDANLDIFHDCHN